MPRELAARSDQPAARLDSVQTRSEVFLLHARHGSPSEMHGGAWRACHRFDVGASRASGLRRWAEPPRRGAAGWAWSGRGSRSGPLPRTFALAMANASAEFCAAARRAEAVFEAEQDPAVAAAVYEHGSASRSASARRAASPASGGRAPYGTVVERVLALSTVSTF
jgi:hypothetical protein